jgi:enediyne biosynthesis protein E3
MMAISGSFLRSLLRRPLALDPNDLDLLRRGFSPASPAVQSILNNVVGSFAAGYNAALEHEPHELTFATLSAGLTGFAYEGAAMSTTLLDLLTGTRGRRLAALERASGQRYTHLIHVGAGWAFAQMRLRPWTGVHFGRSPLHWLAWDGWGFHQAFFRPVPVFAGQIERAARKETRPIRDQGVGRALWFYAGADPTRIAGVIATFAPDRRADLWAGIGLAAAYTGAQSADALQELLKVSIGFHHHLAQGAAFAAKAHHLSGIVTPQVSSAVKILTGADPETAAEWTDASLRAVANHDHTPRAYEDWRAGIRRTWAVHTGGVTA